MGIWISSGEGLPHIMGPPVGKTPGFDNDEQKRMQRCHDANIMFRICDVVSCVHGLQQHIVAAKPVAIDSCILCLCNYICGYIMLL